MCVWGGLSQNEVSFFPLKEPFFVTKQRHLVLRHIHVYTIYLFFDMCFLFLSRVGLSHPKYMDFVVLYVVFQHHFIGKMYRNKKCFIGDYNIDRYFYL